LFITKTIFFVGASLSDSDVSVALESISESFSGRGGKHYALLPWMEASKAEIMHWRDFFGIHIIKYEATKGHPEIDIFLNSIIDLISD
jgi:hypothetical protein